MKRGQAFETMMLVISVIVAIAILGVLLNILGGISFGVGDPKAVMTDGLKSIQAKGFGVTQPKKSNFEVNAYVMRGEVIGDLPVLEDELEFACASSSGICDNDKLVVTKKSVDAKTNIEVYITVCGDSTKTRNPKYCVGIGRQGAESRDECLKACQINK
ncbi:hypothetical protein HZC09_05575 [Candidatus Micrarchaeota archaeon]|nr:hypothetical protein [Candidatus Micrarchaeota archaeon]